MNTTNQPGIIETRTVIVGTEDCSTRQPGPLLGNVTAVNNRISVLEVGTFQGAEIQGDPDILVPKEGSNVLVPAAPLSALDPITEVCSAQEAEAGASSRPTTRQTARPTFPEVGPNGEPLIKLGTRNDLRPIPDELATLRRIPGPIPWIAYTLALVEFCERFSYYGTTAVFVNFVQRPLPEGSKTGAERSGQSGALGMGQRLSAGLTLFLALWSYVTPLLGAYIAERYWGRFRTIQIAFVIAFTGHFFLIISAIPPVIVDPNSAIACFSVGIVLIGIGVGGFKSNLLVLIAEQCTETFAMQVVIDEYDCKYIMDPSVTVSKVYLYFYLMANLGMLSGSTAMFYAEQRVGFWLAFLVPTLVLCFCPTIILVCRNQYHWTPRSKFAIKYAVKVWIVAIWSRLCWKPCEFFSELNRNGFWENGKPSNQGSPPTWMMAIDDAWVEGLRRGMLACKVFLWLPLYWLAYGQMANNLTSQAATMQLNGVPNRIVMNLNPLFIILLIPIMDQFVFMPLRRRRIHFTPTKRITCGFALASCAMISAAVTQHFIYKRSPCGTHASSCAKLPEHPVSVWVQIVPYALLAASEILGTVTILEYAFTKAPRGMRSFVTAIALSMNTISVALSQALIPLAKDPRLVWNYGVVAVLTAGAGVLFWYWSRRVDEHEDFMANMPEGVNPGQRPGVDIELDDRVKTLTIRGSSTGTEAQKITDDV